ncbi:MAG: hypothetical protein KAU31_15385, partial [Spirochaetaceae bacterium]|nr:hypothetical protein [Spirochaetaceae bacterium]
MSKAHRGRPLKEETAQSGRGTCPVTGRSGVKLLYEQEIDGKKVMVSKAGKASLANIKRRQAKSKKKAQPVAAAPEPAAPKPEPVAPEPVVEAPEPAAEAPE